MRYAVPAALFLGCFCGGALQVRADDSSAERGHQIVVENCSACHAVEKAGNSPNSLSPPFRTLHEHYRVDNLAEALAEGIYVGHQQMPQITLSSTQIGDVIAYLKSLER